MLEVFCIDCRWISQAEAIVSKLQTLDSEKKDDEPTILIVADTVCCLLAFFVRGSFYLCRRLSPVELQEMSKHGIT